MEFLLFCCFFVGGVEGFSCFFDFACVVYEDEVAFFDGHFWSSFDWFFDWFCLLCFAFDFAHKGYDCNEVNLKLNTLF